MQIAFPCFMLCTVCVQIENHNMGIRDAVDLNSPTYDTAWTRYHPMDMVDGASEDFKFDNHYCDAN